MTSYAVSAALCYMMPNTRSLFIYAAGAFSGYLLSRLSDYVRARLRDLSTFFWPSAPNVSERQYVELPKRPEPQIYVSKLKTEYTLPDQIELDLSTPIKTDVQERVYTCATKTLQQASEIPPVSPQKTPKELQIEEAIANEAFINELYMAEAADEMALLEGN